MNKNCPICGAPISEYDEVCTGCGCDAHLLEYLTAPRCKQPEPNLPAEPKPAVKPHQLFAGYGHMLILCENGDLYAMGSNYCGCCGEDLPPMMNAPCLMASGVRHAAAGYRHSLYVTNDGDVHIVGRSNFADRFPGFHHASKVYAHCTRDVFVIEDTNGRFWVFGDPEDADLMEKETVLRQLDEMTYEYTDNETWVECQGYSNVTGQSHYTSTTPDSPIALPGMEEYLRGEEYRGLVRRYGEANVQIRFAKFFSDVVDSRFYSFKNGRRTNVRKFLCTCTPEVVLVHRHLYHPILLTAFFSTERWFCGSWPVQEGTHTCEHPVIRDVNIGEWNRCCMTENAIICVDQQHKLSILRRHDLSAPVVVSGIASFALYGHKQSDDRIILLTDRNELVMASIEGLLRGIGLCSFRTCRCQEEEKKWIWDD